MDRFLPYDDPLAQHIEQRASELLARLQKLDVEQIDMPEYCKIYYRGSHSSRLFFSIETSAHILYRSIKETGKSCPELTVMDYGAGLGSLYMLAGLLGFRKVVYNDHLADWKNAAQKIANALDVRIDSYVVGDIDDTIKQLQEQDIICDLVLSRNVLEHIYDLRHFFNALHAYAPRVIVFSSTTANLYNPAANIKHRLWHRRWEKQYRHKRAEYIAKQSANLSGNEIHALTTATRGLSFKDIDAALLVYREAKRMPDGSVHRSNTCDPETGVWAEHLLSFDEYRQLIDAKKFDTAFRPGFWDTHYRGNWKNRGSRFFNKMIRSGGKLSFRLAPFIYVIAKGRG